MATSNFFYILVWAIEHLKIGFVHGLPVPLVSVNITAQHPNGTFNHGDPNILCTPTSWTTFLTFFLGNYVAHAATVVTAPGQQTMETAFALIMALLYPGSGLVRGLDAVFRASSLGKSPLEQAARAGAFCMVVRSRTWEPESKQRFQAYYELGKATQRVCTQVLNEKTTVIERETNHTQKNVSGPEGCVPSNIEVKDMPHTSHLELDRNTTSPRTVDRTDVRLIFTNLKTVIPIYAREHINNWVYTTLRFHELSRKEHKQMYGHCKLSPQYSLAVLPRDTKVVPLDATVAQTDLKITSNYNVAAAYVALFQALFAIYTLYQSWGTQLQTWGCTAFSLTVTPYLIMSVVNLLGNVLTANYPYRYLVSSDIMDEAVKRHCRFTGVVGRVLPLRTVEALEAGTAIEPYIDVPTTFICRGDYYETDNNDETSSVERNEAEDADHITENDNRNPDFEIVRHAIERAETTTLQVPNCTRFVRHTDHLLDLPTGTTGTLSSAAPAQKSMSVSALRMLWARSLLIYFTISAIPIVIIGGLTRFGIGSDGTRQTEGFFTAWIISGILLGPIITYNSLKSWTAGARHALVETTLLGAEILIPILFLVPPIAGWVLVGMQLRKWGDCVYFG